MTKAILKSASCVLALCLVTQNAFADDFDRSEIRGDTYCFPAKYATEMIRKIDKADDDRRDVVDIKMDPVFKIYDGGDLPDRFFLRLDDAPAQDFTIGPSGAVPDFLAVLNATPTAEDGGICITDPARAGRPGDDENLYFEMGLRPKFQAAGPRYDTSTLKEGTKDGRELFKKMIPAVARMFMPDIDHLSIHMEDSKMVPVVNLVKGGVVFGTVDTTPYGEGHVVSLDDIKDTGAEAIEITGGAFSLSPSPSIKTMQRFGMGEKTLYTQNENGEWVR